MQKPVVQPRLHTLQLYPNAVYSMDFQCSSTSKLVKILVSACQLQSCCEYISKCASLLAPAELEDRPENESDTAMGIHVIQDSAKPHGRCAWLQVRYIMHVWPQWCRLDCLSSKNHLLAAWYRSCSFCTRIRPLRTAAWLTSSSSGSSSSSQSTHSTSRFSISLVRLPADSFCRR